MSCLKQIEKISQGKWRRKDGVTRFIRVDAKDWMKIVLTSDTFCRDRVRVRLIFKTYLLIVQNATTKLRYQ